MPFTVYVAADLYTQKVNLEFELPTVPTVAELVQIVQSTFNNEAAALKPPTLALQTIRVTKLQVYRDEDGSWADLQSPTQLTEFAQLYVFQADPQYQESQQPIPAARKPSRLQPVSPASIYTPIRSFVDPAPVTSTPTPLRQSQHSLSRAPEPLPPLPSYSTRHSSPPRPSAGTYVPATTLASSPVPPVAAAPTAYLARSSPSFATGPASPERSHLARAPVPDHPSQRDKISYLFDEMDTNGNRVIEPEEFRSLIRSLGIDFSNATLADLFSKGDMDRDGVLSLGEFSQFFSFYPTLLDAAFYRLRDIQEARNLQAQLAEERRSLDAAREQRARAAAMAAECARLVTEATVKVRDAEAEQANKANREAEVRHVTNQCVADLDLSRRTKDIANSDVAAGRDREASHRVALANAEADVREAEQRMSTQHELLATCQEKERQLHQMLIEAQRESERQHHALLAAQAEAARRREMEHSAAAQLTDAQRELQRLNDRLIAAERDEMLKMERQRELNAVLNEAAEEVARAVRVLEERRSEAVLLAQREASNRQTCTEADANVLAAERRLVSRDQDILSFNQRRAAMEQQERPLLEQEIRLRVQRDSLDENEVRFRRDAVSYFDNARAAAATVGSVTGATSIKSLSPPRGQY